ncbi:lipopolysaccharide biosynthesis protein [Sphingomonas sp. Root710]|uniref:GumC family protein n=1 Tax=Sphingomonas sp. Root710 TaxID=1736594 RepID=UPI0006FC8D61|nr:lipopolysaccharide biosynthesis protein [Sphingomonas sp. Root710]KRB82567.1 lipopolysaccharide biosynthesis protein [Sphingomonas sp. Root710]
MNAAIDPAANDLELADGLLGYLPQILYQRRWFVIIPFVVCALTGVGLAYGLPALYRSSATVVVESKELPEAIAAASVTDLIDQRIARIKQQILSRPGLIELIQNNELYMADRRKSSLSTIIEKMRDATAITPVTADIDRMAAARGGSSTIAFSISFTYSDPAKAQAVTQQFTEKLLKLDSSELSAKADATVGFLRGQASQIQAQISEIEGKIQDIKARNGLALSRVGGFIPSTSNYDVQIAQLQRENTELQGKLSSNSTNADDRVGQAEAALAAAQALYSDNHPDVIAAKQKLTEARAAAKANVNPRTNPAISAQIAANNRTIASLSGARSSDMSRASAAVAAQSGAPLIEESIRQLEAKADGLRGNYERISGNLLAAEAAQKMDAEQRGERLVLVDPPTLPDEPNSPNRSLLVIGGLAVGATLGLGLALLIELLRRPIRGAAALQGMLGVGPLVVIPTLKPKARRGAGKRRKRKKGLFTRRKAAAA